MYCYHPTSEKKRSCFQKHIANHMNFFRKHNKRLKLEEFYSPAAPKESRVRELGRVQVLIEFLCVGEHCTVADSCYCCGRLSILLVSGSWNKFVTHTLPECTTLFPRDRLPHHISWLLFIASHSHSPCPGGILLSFPSLPFPFLAVGFMHFP